jgi:hypothetical protein
MTIICRRTLQAATVLFLLAVLSTQSFAVDCSDMSGEWVRYSYQCPVDQGYTHCTQTGNAPSAGPVRIENGNISGVLHESGTGPSYQILGHCPRSPLPFLDLEEQSQGSTIKRRFVVARHGPGKDYFTLLLRRESTKTPDGKNFLEIIYIKQDDPRFRDHSFVVSGEVNLAALENRLISQFSPGKHLAQQQTDVAQAADAKRQQQEEEEAERERQRAQEEQQQAIQDAANQIAAAISQAYAGEGQSGNPAFGGYSPGSTTTGRGFGNSGAGSPDQDVIEKCNGVSRSCIRLTPHDSSDYRERYYTVENRCRGKNIIFTFCSIVDNGFQPGFVCIGGKRTYIGLGPNTGRYTDRISWTGLTNNWPNKRAEGFRFYWSIACGDDPNANVDVTLDAYLRTQGVNPR